MKRTERSHVINRPGRLISQTIALALAGCSSVPDYLNPVEWYKDTKDWVIGDDDDQAIEMKKTPMPGEGKSYPKLSSVPERPVMPSTETEREMAAQGLAADRSHARYSDKVIRSQTVEVTPSMPRPARVSAIVPKASRSMPAPPPIETMQAAPSAKVSNPPLAPAMESTASAVLPPIPGMEFSGTTKPPPPAAIGEPKVASAFDGLGKDNFGRPVAVSSRKIATVLFRDGSSQLSKRARAQVSAAYRAHRAEGGVLRVVGHASSRTRNLDPLRHHLANFRISLARANRVAQALIRLGVKPDKIFTEAKSDSQQLYTEVMPAGEGANRRVEILLEK